LLFQRPTRNLTNFCRICMESSEVECVRCLVKMQMRSYKHMLYVFAVNRELHKKTTPEIALHIIKFLTHFTN
jgi:hypothetical protein